MKRNTLIMMLAALLVLPILTIGLTSCATTEEQVGETDAERAARLAAEEAARNRDQFLNEHAFFDYDRYDIRPDAAEVLRFKADYMANNGGITVEVQGHCDERGSLQYNIALGDRRAHAAANFVESLGVDPSRLSAVTYGEERPLDPGHDEDAWAQNRRAQFVIVSE